MLNSDLNNNYTAVELVDIDKYKKNYILLEDSVVKIYNNNDCRELTSIKYNSYALKGSNALMGLSFDKEILTITYHINPNNSILRKINISTDQKFTEEYFTEICNPLKPTECKTEKVNLPDKLTEEQALEKVKEMPEVKQFIKLVDKWGYNIYDEILDNNDEAYYSLRIYEVKDVEDVTLNWYLVNKYTGEIKTELGN